VQARARKAARPEAVEPLGFERFYRQQWPAAVRLAHLLTGDSWVAEDVAQDALSRVEPRYEGLDNPGAFLRTCVVNACRSHHRTRVREAKRLLRIVPAASTGLDVRELLDAVDRLPYRQKAVLVLRYYEDRTEAEIAAILGCRPGTVKSLAARGLSRLHREIER